jgi:GNAT superfamily N-acetyltransferase
MRITCDRLEDVDDGVALGAELHAESVYAQFPYDVDYTTQFGINVVHASDHVLLCARDHNDRLIGMLIGGIQELCFSPVKYAVDHTFYVRKERRGSLAAAKLLAAFEQWAKDRGATMIRPAVTAGVNGAAVRLYKAMGYREIGPILEKVL